MNTETKTEVFQLLRVVIQHSSLNFKIYAHINVFLHPANTFSIYYQALCQGLSLHFLPLSACFCIKLKREISNNSCSISMANLEVIPAKSFDKNLKRMLTPQSLSSSKASCFLELYTIFLSTNNHDSSVPPWLVFMLMLQCFWYLLSPVFKPLSAARW